MSNGPSLPLDTGPPQRSALRPGQAQASILLCSCVEHRAAPLPVRSAARRPVVVFAGSLPGSSLPCSSLPAAACRAAVCWAAMPCGVRSLSSACRQAHCGASHPRTSMRRLLRVPPRGPFSSSVHQMRSPPPQAVPIQDCTDRKDLHGPLERTASAALVTLFVPPLRGCCRAGLALM